ncbi:MAG: veratrol--corrinoid protein metyltransferase [Eubacteriaceae bacterium]|nr:veratrol--corrinoid protein metyltransferase [Eubacteriaceae bacterium]
MSNQTPKEAYLKLGRGELPDSVVNYTMGMPGINDSHPCSMVGARIFDQGPPVPGAPRKDMWGVPYASNKETNFAGLPAPGEFILKDIVHWDKYIKTPPMPEVDWRQLAHDAYNNPKMPINRERQAILLGGPLMPFQQLMAFMGFTEGLCALYEEPEKCKELLNYILDFLMPVVENSVAYFEPDIFYILDDTASKLQPFVSLEMYRDILKPAYERIAEPANKRGIPIQFHNCGRCEDFIDDMIDFGVVYWDPAQTKNDLLGIKEKYKGKIVICGGYDWVLPDTYPVIEKEYVVDLVRSTIDKYAPGGGYAFCGGALGAAGDTAIENANKWAREEVYNYGLDYYLK